MYYYLIKMKSKIFLLLLANILCLNVFTQNSFTISGYVQDDETGENLIGVSIYDKLSLKGTVTNQYGFYSLTLEEGKYDITYSFIGLESQNKSVDLNKDIRLNISLKRNTIITNEVIVTGEK